MNKAYFLNLIRQLDGYDLEFLSSGNMSIRLGEDLFAITPSGIPYDQLTEEDVSIVNSKGELLEGLKPSSDLGFHLTIYKKREDVSSIIHSHSHYAVVMSALGKPLRVLSTLHADYFGQNIPCMRYVNHRTGDVGEEFIALKTNQALLKFHGTIIVDSDPGRVIKKTVALEEVARINFHINLLGKKITSLSNTDIGQLSSYYTKQYGQG